MPRLHKDMSPRVNLTQRPGDAKAHPHYVNLLPPCNHACPAGENIQAWLAEAQAGHWRQAWEILVAHNPFPEIHGRVCYHPCEDGCNRGALDTPVQIHAVERFLGDLAAAEGWRPPVAVASGKRVLVVGAGPSGLSAAWHLALLGHQVEIQDAGEEPGGMMRYGIPAYRLPREILTGAVERLRQLGVQIRCNTRIDDLLAARQAGGFDAVYLALGAQAGRHIDIPARDAARVLDAVGYLHAAAAGEAPLLGRRVVVYGGGNTAMDAARTARRLGADDAMVVFRRDQGHMSAHDSELQDARSEGIRVKWLSSITEVTGEQITVEKMVLDDQGHAQPTGVYETLQADSLVLAVGQVSELDFLRTVPGIQIDAQGTVQVGDDLQTGHPGIFAGGDMTPSVRSVTFATGMGRKAARHIDAWLAGTRWQATPSPRVVGFEELHLPIYDDALAAHNAQRPAEQRTRDFAEVSAGLDATQALHEAARCLSCGNCYECDNCYAACPSQAILRNGPGAGYQVDLLRCNGCAACYEQCPCHAIEMLAENDATAVTEEVLP